MDTRTGDQKAKKPQGRYCPQTLENRIQSGFKRGDVYCLWKRYRDRAVRVCVYVSTTANRNLCIGWMHASLCVCVRVYQVRMFTPDKIKYADQLYGIAEVQQDLDLRQQSLFEDYVSSGYVSEDLVAGVCVCVCVWRNACRHACGRAVFSLSPPQPLPASSGFNFLCVQNLFLHSIIDISAFRPADAQPSHTLSRAVRGYAHTESNMRTHIHTHTYMHNSDSFGADEAEEDTEEGDLIYQNTRYNASSLHSFC